MVLGVEKIWKSWSMQWKIITWLYINWCIKFWSFVCTTIQYFSKTYSTNICICMKNAMLDSQSHALNIIVTFVLNKEWRIFEPGHFVILTAMIVIRHYRNGHRFYYFWQTSRRTTTMNIVNTFSIYGNFLIIIIP